jgi:hypothetical protein
MASESAWWWVVRQAYQIPDIVSDRAAMDVIARKLAAVVTPPQGNLLPSAAGLGEENLRASATLIIQRICSLGADGELDDLLLREDIDGDRVFKRLTRGQPLEIEHRPLIDAAIQGVIGWVKENPSLPESLREDNAPPAQGSRS